MGNDLLTNLLKKIYGRAGARTRKPWIDLTSDDKSDMQLTALTGACHTVKEVNFCFVWT